MNQDVRHPLRPTSPWSDRVRPPDPPAPTDLKGTGLPQAPASAPTPVMTAPEAQPDAERGLGADVSGSAASTPESPVSTGGAGALPRSLAPEPINRSSPLDPRGSPRFAARYEAAYPRLLAQVEANAKTIAAEDPGLARAYAQSCRPLPPGLPPESYPSWCLRHPGPLWRPLYPVMEPYLGTPRQVAFARSIQTRLYPMIRRFALARANDPAIPPADQTKYRDALRCIGLQAHASFWIDSRDKPVARILADAIARGATTSPTVMQLVGPHRKRGS